MSLSYYPHKKVVPKDATIEEICRKGRELKSPYLISVCYGIYLTGARVSEILKVKAKDIEMINSENGKMIRVHLYTAKNRRNTERYISIPYDNPASIWEKKMLKYLLLYAKNFQPQQRLWCIEGQDEKDEKRLITNARKEIWRKFHEKIEFDIECKEDRKIGERERINKKTKEVEMVPIFKTFNLIGTKQIQLYPHHLRACRITHLVRDYKITTYALQYFAGWASSELADVYIRQSPEMLDKCMVPK